MGSVSNRRHGGKRTHDRRGAGRGVLLSARGEEVAEEAVVEIAGPEAVGRHLGATTVGPDSAAHRFECRERGYRGWEWIAVIACAPGTEHVTVNEVSLHAGDHALAAPAWVPYEDRIRPGDLRPGDRLPLKTDDPRVTDPDDPADTAGSAGSADGVPRNPGARRSLTRAGWEAAVRRWTTGEDAPDPEFAGLAERSCDSCAFWLPLQRHVRTGAAGSGGRAGKAGRAGQAGIPEVGVCANEFSADGRVVASDYGCGAHSETPREAGEGSASRTAYDDGGPERY